MRITRSKRRMMQLCSILLVCVSSLYAAEYMVNPGESIQAAIAAASNGDTVTVMPGTYVETFNLFGNLNLLGKAITLTGTDPTDPAVVAATIIDGNQTGGSVILCNSGEGPDTLITGLTITNGRGSEGGGMLNWKSSPTVTHCIFRNNLSVGGFGGGAGMGNFESNSIVSHCTFESNTGSTAGMFNAESNTTVSYCTFRNNNGRAMNNWYSSPIVTHCIFSQNVPNYIGGSPVGGGGMGNYQGNPKISHCIFSGNVAGDDAGMSNGESSPEVSHCVFIGNRAIGGPFGQGRGITGGMFSYMGSPKVTNSIFWDNTDSDDQYEIYSFMTNLTVEYCNVQGGYEGNMSLDPLFADAAGTDGIIGTADDDLRLTADSPCINAGSNDLIGADWADLDADGITEDETVPYDLDDNPRIENDIVDMGAYEFVETAIPVAVDVKPANCPNPVNVGSKGVVSVAILGTEVFDVNDIDPNSVQLEGVPVLRWSYEDVAALAADDADCACSADGPDGFMDMTLKVDTQQLAAAMGPVEDGQEWMLHLNGQLNDGTAIEGTDCVLIIQKGGRVKMMEVTPAAHWKLDGDATDASGNEHDGTAFGDPVWTIDGAKEGAIELDGNGDFVSVPAHSDLQPNFPFSVSLWMKADDPLSGDPIITAGPPDDFTYYSGFGIRLMADLSGRVKATYKNGGPTSPAGRHGKNGATVLQAATWYHVAAVFRGYMDIDLYVNGISEGDYDNGTAESIVYSNNDFLIGSYAGTDQFFDGAIDDVRIYNRALSQDQVTQLYNLTEPTEPVTR